MTEVRYLTAGESHGPGLTMIVEGVPGGLTLTEDQIASAKASAIREVRNQAVKVAVAAAQDVIAAQTTPAEANKLIDDAIAEVGAKLH